MVVLLVDLVPVVWLGFCKFSVSLLIGIIWNELYMVHCDCYHSNSL